MYVLLYKEGIFWKVLREASNTLYLWERGNGGLDEKETSFSLYTSNFFCHKAHAPYSKQNFF